MFRRTSGGCFGALLAVASTFVAAPSVTHAGTPFTDVGDSPFVADIEWAAEEGITGGCTPTTFCPEAIVTRAQMASFLVRMFDLPPTGNDYFVDDENSIHEHDINALYESGITGGCRFVGDGPSDYCPRNPVSREQMAAFIVRAAGLPARYDVNPFYDDDFRFFETDIGIFAAGGVGSGCGAYRYCPALGVTRAQMTAFLRRVEDPVTPPPEQAPCDRSYTPYLCIPSPPPPLDCTDITHRNFFVRPPDPHVFDGNLNGIGCET